jgi:predicted CoA-binding protein
MPTIDQKIEQFLSSPAFGVVGASTVREKYGNKVLRCYLQKGRRAIPVHPREREIEGVACVRSIAELPSEVRSLSFITPPEVTEQLVEQAIARGIRNVWMQPGAESERAVARCEEAGVDVIADGTCLLVVLGYHEAWSPVGA